MLSIILLIFTLFLAFIYFFVLGYYLGARDIENDLYPIIKDLQDELKEVKSVPMKDLEEIDFTRIDK